MRILKLNFFITLFLVIAVAFQFFTGCGSDTPEIEKNTLALINNKKIDKDDFFRKLQQLRQRTGAPDNGEVRRSILKNYVAEEVFIAEARKRGYHQDSDGEYEREKIETQELLNAYFERFVIPKISVTEKELRELYYRFNTKIKASHLYASTQKEADSLYRALQTGASFERLARSIFEDPVLRESGGSLGYFTVDEMEPAFENAAYSMQVGEISKPVKTSDGYSIIRVDARQKTSVPTEYAYADKRPRLRSYLMQRKKKKAAREVVDSLQQALDIQFNQQILQELFSVLESNKDKDFTREQSLDLPNVTQLENRELLSSKVGAWTVAKFRKYARFTSKKQQNWIRNQESLKDFISGLVVRSFMLSQARAAGLHKTADYQQQVAELMDVYLLKRMENQLKQQMVIPVDSLRAYFEHDPRRFSLPPEINLREIVLETEQDAQLVQNRLESGDAFPELAKKYSIRRWSGINGGELGYLTPQDIGRKWSNLVFSLEKDEWTGPVKMDSFYVFLKCIGKKPAQLRSFEEAKEDVEAALKTMWWADQRQQKLSEFREHFRVMSFPEKLRNIRRN